MLLRRLRSSLNIRGWRGTWRRVLQEIKGKKLPSSQPHLLPLVATCSAFKVPSADTPAISVIIPVHGQIAHTMACLRSLAACGDRTSFEVIVVDDASPDASAEALAQVPGLRLLRLPRNLGFIGACNLGAENARGQFLCFLNNDTQVTPGWLDALRACFDDLPDCGIAGARLLYPDGRLQECGALVFSDGSAWNCGRFESPDQPRYLYRRDCDYVSGAALMIPAELFRAVGCFDMRYAPAYYEDTDLAFAVRAAGRRVVVQPASTVIHCEGVTAGLDPEHGVKRYQVRNRALFAAKWAHVLDRQLAPGASEFSAIVRCQAARPRLLVIDATLPDPTRDSGSLRLIQMLRLAGRLGWQVCLLSDDGRMDPVLVARLGSVGIEVVDSPRPHDWLRRHGHAFGAVLLSRYPVAAIWMALARRFAPQAKLIFDTVDLHFLREQRAALSAGMRATAFSATRKRELDLIRKADATLLTSEVERRLVGEIVQDAKLILLSNVHDVRGRHTSFGERKDLLFIGGFDHPPNVDAVRWFLATTWPLILERNREIQLHLVGSVDATLRAEFSVAGVQVHGRVEQLEPWLDRCKVSIAPLRFGAGVKGKINSAMASGLPVVATSIAAEAMHLVDGHDVLLADTPQAFASAVINIYDDSALWGRLSDGALVNVARHFSHDKALAALDEALRAT